MSVVLSEHLPLLASAPDGIQNLRGLILELAVRGKLVPQEPTDEPANELLKRIAKERARLEAEGTCRKSKPTPPVSNDEQPFALPEGWAWIRLGQIGDWGAGATPLRSNPRYYGGSIPWFKSGELTSDFISDAEEHVTELALKECSLRQNRTGDVLIAMYGATIGKTAILAKPATTNQAVCACTPNTGVFNRYLLTLLKALKPNFIGQGAGGAQPNISREKIVATVAALPPEAEQHRIVAKVDDLMVLCDRLEAEQADAASAHTRLVETLLGTLTQSTGAADLASNWQRLAEHFDTLFTTEASIDALKQTLLRLALMGRLVPQNFADEPARELLNRIQMEFVAADAGMRLRKAKPLPPVDHKEKPFEAPQNWEWIRLQDIINVSSGDGLTSEKMTEAGDVPVYGGNGVTGRHDQANIDKPTLVIGRVGFYCGSIHLTPAKAWVTDNALRVRFSEKNLSIEFLFWLLKATNLKGNQSATAQPLVSGKTIYPIVVALPPLAEQQRIVSKIEKLMALCERLKADLVTARQQQVTLADVLIESALEAA